MMSYIVRHRTTYRYEREVAFSRLVAHLAPRAGSDSQGSGTAVLSETYLPAGKVSVFYTLTVAGTTGGMTHWKRAPCRASSFCTAPMLS